MAATWLMQAGADNWESVPSPHACRMMIDGRQLLLMKATVTPPFSFACG
jgi:hypothetical protein